MLHRDLKPDNIMITTHGMAKIIDFGSVKIAGIQEISKPVERIELLGTKNYTAPEYLLGVEGSNRSDIYTLGVLVYNLPTCLHANCLMTNRCRAILTGAP